MSPSHSQSSFQSDIQRWRETGCSASSVADPSTQSSLRWPETACSASSVAGPSPHTVMLPAAICVRPASAITEWIIPAASAAFAIASRSASFSHLTTTLTLPFVS